MKKILSTALMAIVLSAAVVDTINAARATDTAAMTAARARRGGGRRPAARGRGRGVRAMRNNSKKVQIVLETAKKTDNPVVKAEAIRTANELAKELLMDLQDRTWAGDILGKYTPDQVATAAKKYTDLEIQRTNLVRDIETKQAELDGMSTKSMIFWTKAEGGKEEAHKVASQELAEMKATLRDVNKAMRNQAVIAGKEACASIRMAVGALTGATLAGVAYGIDKYKYEGAGMTYLGEKYTSAREELAMLPEEGYVAYGRRGISKAYGAVGGVATSISDWATTQYNKLPDVAYIGSKARADRAAATKAIKDVQNTEVKIETEVKKLDKAPEGTPANEKIQDKIDELKDQQNQQMEKAENLVDKVNESTNNEKGAGE